MPTPRDWWIDYLSQLINFAFNAPPAIWPCWCI